MKKYESKIKLSIPNVGYIEVAGTSGFVANIFRLIRVEFYEHLLEVLKTFKGEYEVVEKQNGKTTEVEIVEK